MAESVVMGAQKGGEEQSQELPRFGGRDEGHAVWPEWLQQLKEVVIFNQGEVAFKMIKGEEDYSEVAAGTEAVDVEDLITMCLMKQSDAGIQYNEKWVEKKRGTCTRGAGSTSMDQEGAMAGYVLTAVDLPAGDP